MERQTAYLGEPTEHWIGLLRADDPLERRLAAHALGEIGPDAHDAAGPLEEALADPVSFVRVWAAAALIRIVPEGSRAVPALLAATRDETPFVRSLAAWLLGRARPGLPGIAQAVPTLEGLCQDPDPSVRAEAELALARAVLPHRPASAPDAHPASNA